MGYYTHDAVLVTAAGWAMEGRYPGCEPPDVDAFRQSLPGAWRSLVIGPIVTPYEDRVHFAFLPDGSKEGWPESDEGDAYRERFAELFSFTYEDGSSPFEVIAVRYGDSADYPLGSLGIQRYAVMKGWGKATAESSQSSGSPG